MGFDNRIQEKLIQDLRDPDPEVRSHAATCLGARNNLGAIGPLRQALNDLDPEVRKWVVRALGKIGHPNVIGPLTQALYDPYPDVRGESVSALGGLPIEILAPADERDRVFPLSYERKVRLRSTLFEVLRLLRGALLDPYPAIRELAAFYLDLLQRYRDMCE